MGIDTSTRGHGVGTGVAKVGTLLRGLSPTEKRSGRKPEVLYRERK